MEAAQQNAELMKGKLTTEGKVTHKQTSK